MLDGLDVLMGTPYTASATVLTTNKFTGLLLVITLAKATEVHHAKEAYAPAQFVGPLPYTAIQPRQDSQGVVVQTGEWYKVDPAPRSPFL